MVNCGRLKYSVRLNVRRRQYGAVHSNDGRPAETEDKCEEEKCLVSDANSV